MRKLPPGSRHPAILALSLAFALLALASIALAAQGTAAADLDPSLLRIDGLLADAQHSYDLGNYEAAAESLGKARALYAALYPAGSYAPLDFWQRLVGMALDTNNTRVIRRNDPLYREMTQYLSIARVDYENGLVLKKAGKTAEAATNFAAARALIANVTRTFPLNAEAGFLTLQILKATNEADFRASLHSRIAEAAALLKTDPVRAYAAIADLAGIEPDNAEIGALLLRAEVATGKRRPEPTVAEKSRSRELVDQARQLMKTGRLGDLGPAETLLDEALALDPANREAQTLILNIQTLKGGGPDKALGAEDSRRLADARSYFTQGMYNQARAALNGLLANEATKSRDVLLLDAQLNQLGY
jgi:hypothetical protein